MIDWIASKHADCSALHICTDSSKELGTDHDCLRVQTGFLEHKDPRPRIVSGMRVLKTPPILGDHLDQSVLTALATRHTQKPTLPRYQDDPATKELFRIAKRTRTAYTCRCCRSVSKEHSCKSWKRALRSRRDGYQAWREARVTAAVAGDWRAFSQCKHSPNKGWESKLAENLQPSEPHEALHTHYSKIFDTGAELTRRSHHPCRSPDITDYRRVAKLAVLVTMGFVTTCSLPSASCRRASASC